MIRSVKLGFAQLKSTMIGTLVVGLVFLASGQIFINSVFAAAGEGTATIRTGTGGTNASDATYGAAAGTASVTVGQKSYIRLNLTVGASDIAASEDNVTVQINTNLFPTNGWELAKEAALTDLNTVGEWYVAYTDTDSETTNNATISFAASAAVDTGLITIQANQQMDATDIISIYAVVQDNHYQLAASAVDIQTDDVGADSLTSLAANPTISTAASSSSSSLTLGANSVVGAAGSTTLNLSVPFALDAGDSVGMTFADSVKVSEVGAAVSGTFEGASNITCSAAGQVVTCITDGPTATTGTIIMTGITTLYADTENVDVGVLDENVAGHYIALGLNSAMTDITAANAAATVTLATPAIHGVGNTTLALSLPFALDAADTIDITFPSHIDVSGVGAAVTGTLEGGSNITCADAAQVVTCTTDGATNSSGTVIMTGITARASGTTDVTGVEVENEGVSSDDIATDTTVALTDTTAGTITGSNLSLSNYKAAADTSVILNMTLPHGLPNDGKFVITFANGFDLSSVTTVDSNVGVNGTFTVSDDANVLTVERNGDGTAIADAAAISLTLSTIGNPDSAQTIDAFTFQTTTTDDDVIDEIDDVPGISITSASQPVNTGGGGGGGTSQTTNTTSNTQTSSTVIKIDTVQGSAAYSGPIQIKNVVIDEPNNTSMAQLTGVAGVLNLKPNKDSTISVVFPANTQVTSTSKWDGTIQPPLVKSTNLVSVEGDKIEGSNDLLMREDVLTVVQVGAAQPLKFSQPVTLSIPVSAPDNAKVNIYSSMDADLWKTMMQLTVSGGTVKVTTDHFTYFAVQATEETKDLIEAQNPPVTTGFTDIKGHWAEAYINKLADMKVVSGKTATMFDPDAPITRAELVKIATKAFNIPIDPALTPSTFSDVSTSDWFITFVNAARKAGIVEGIGGNLFAPNVAVDRAAALKIMLKAAGFDQTTPKALFNDVNVKDWFAGYVTFASENGVVEGYGNGIFGPERKITRAEACKIIVKLMEMKK